MDDTLTLEPFEARILGVLIEKELTTPDHYPLTLNALANGCNQKSNRSPVLELSNATVSMLLDKLVVRGLVGRVQRAGSRVEHYRHNARERLHCQEPQLAILAELLTRGPQSASQLRKRTERMSKMESQAIFDSHVEQLIRHGFVKRIPAGMGSRTERLVQEFSPDAHPLEETAAPAQPLSTPAPGADLEARVARLERQLAQLAEELGASLSEESSELPE